MAEFTMFDLSEFCGHAEVLGAHRRVRVAPPTLVIEGVDMAEAKSILAALRTGSLRGVLATAGKSDAAPPATETGAPAKPELIAPPAPAEEASPKPRVTPVKSAKVQAASEPAAVEDEDDDPAPRRPAAPRGNAIPEAVRTATKLRVVVEWLVERGHKTPDALVKAAEAAREHISLLASFDNLEERVRRTAAVLGIED